MVTNSIIYQKKLNSLFNLLSIILLSIKVKAYFAKRKPPITAFSLEINLTSITLLLLIKSEVISPEGYKSSFNASLTVFFIKFSLNLIFDTNDYLPIATIFSTDNLALFIVS